MIAPPHLKLALAAFADCAALAGGGSRDRCFAALPSPAFAREAIRRFRLQLSSQLFWVSCAHAVASPKWRMVVNALVTTRFPHQRPVLRRRALRHAFSAVDIGGDVVRLAVGLRRSPNPAACWPETWRTALSTLAAQGGSFWPDCCCFLARAGVIAGASAEAMFYFVAAFAALILLSLFLYRPLLGGRSFHFRRRLARLRHALRQCFGAPHILLGAWLMGTAIQTAFLVLTANLPNLAALLPLRDWFFAWPLQSWPRSFR